uniref:hypothetical protein n=1 Tax=Candidatus Raskinella chloraquaticus TaxID=1951219 RepID=UPI00366B57C5
FVLSQDQTLKLRFGSGILVTTLDEFPNNPIISDRSVQEKRRTGRNLFDQTFTCPVRKGSAAYVSLSSYSIVKEPGEQFAVRLSTFAFSRRRRLYRR